MALVLSATSPTDNALCRVLCGIGGIAALCGYHTLHMLFATNPRRPRTTWSDHEVNLLLSYLYTRRERIGDVGVFPLIVYHEAATSLGNGKTSNAVASKWASVRSPFFHSSLRLCCANMST